MKHLGFATALASGAMLVTAGTVLLLSRRPGASPHATPHAARRTAASPLHRSRSRLGFADRSDAMRRLLAGVRALPGVESAALATPAPPTSGLVCATPGMNRPAPVSTGLARVSPEYFRTMGIPLRGRDFAARDDGSAPPVVIVNETLARRLWPTGNPIGRRLRLAGPDEPLREVVGVAGDGEAHAAPAGPPSGVVYLPDRQAPAPPTGHFSLVVRTAEDAPSLRVPLSQLVEAVDPDLPVGAVDLDFTPHAPFE
jgi:MacB-like periplasmic core domain